MSEVHFRFTFKLFMERILQVISFLKMKEVLVVYGTCSGNAELVAQAIAEGLSDANLNVSVKRSELVKAEIVKDFRLIVLVCSTWNVGKLNDNYIQFDKDFREMNLKDHYVGIVGLGDSSNYDIFCGAADVMELSVERTSATQLGESLRVDGPPHGRLMEFKDWGNNIGNMYLQHV